MLVKVLGLLCGSAFVIHATEPIWIEDFDSPTGRWPRQVWEQAAGRGGVLHITVPPGSTNPNNTVALPVPIEKVRGKRVFFGSEVKTANISHKPHSWNGVKVMLVLETPNGKTYPQPDIPDGSADWKRFSGWIAVPEATTNITLVLGLENVTGEAWFDHFSISPKIALSATLKPDPNRQIFLGHTATRLRGAMAAPGITEEDVRHFANMWHGNLLRLQLFESATRDRPLEEYDHWLDAQLSHLDHVLDWCEKYGVAAVVDLHSPPGGQAFSAGYITARGRIFTEPQAQDKFVQVWQCIATRYKGRRIIWGFDLVNEPDDSMLAENCLDWNCLADKAARAVRAADPDRILIVEPDQWGGPQGFADFKPLDLQRVVYSFHFYQPMQFTHQGIQQRPAGVTYPGLIAQERWDKARLEREMQPAIEFAKKYRVQMYVGEFSAIRTAPHGSAAKYLADLIDILEQQGFDWSYHAYREWQGWSLEHQGPLDNPVRASEPTDRARIVLQWFDRNDR